ncbi:hypothetical protein JG687_00016910 [Phytophthora cactorum]|uniref:Uncharacterized protein n=1 Tax=Phytophthora cactorum TaxID=29920 RepID=A0A329REX4_9STRA|nr:hypothetical protein Pcac1_g5287 [Phytophthora cactorum]KAG2791709.1 hypothetical protein PC111_g23794 [Phytophthora cactorum]KAG2792155.1 hypothetical protein PC112_g23973 [Phytophthora cactorum]KAG2810307.1 hypothetical protein PC113_g23775 [Phytophthora cactorum]KAG2871803.1 hypothetical protein PC114_g26718 [Phytophthora cactorum]
MHRYLVESEDLERGDFGSMEKREVSSSKGVSDPGRKEREGEKEHQTTWEQDDYNITGKTPGLMLGSP